MMLRTHVVIALIFILIFMPHVNSKIVFLVVALIATMIPDVDTQFSTLGRHKGFRFFQFFTRHRGIFHSLTFCTILAIIFSLLIPIIALPFFLGYAIHIFTDSFTREGVQPFWPCKKKSCWKIKTDSLTETSIFIFALIIDVVLIFGLLI